MRAQYQTIIRDTSRIVQAVSLMLVVSMGIAISNGEYFAVPAFALAALLVGTLGTAGKRLFADAAPPGKLEAMITAAVGWGVTGLVGSFPFLLIAWTVALEPYPAWMNTPPMNPTVAAFRHPLNAVFESMSGFTGTGLTMASVEEKLPRSLHWWRSVTEWIGGVGVIVLTVAILSRPGSGSYTLYESEARSEKIHPSVVSTVQEIWRIYLGLTIGSIVLLLAVGMPLWDAINTA